MADQMRHDAMGCAGDPVVRTPHLDRLAGEGVRFSQAVTPTPICMAARYSLLTGRRAAETRVTANGTLPAADGRDSAPAAWPTLMSCLADAGYQTHGIGKFHFHRRPFGFERQELMEEAIDVLTDDDYLLHLQAAGDPTRYPQGHRDLLYYQPQTGPVAEPLSQNRWVADRSCAFLEEHRRFRPRRPFFLWSSWIAPHPPFAPSAPFDTMYEPGDMAPPVFTDRPLEQLPKPAWAHRGRLDGAHRDGPRMAKIKSLYYGQISHMDDAVGRVLDTLERLGLSANTLVIFCSDHGEMLGDHGLSQKNTPYEASVRVPLLLRWPERLAGGAVSDELVALTDVLPTCLDAAGAAYDPVLPPLAGDSLLGQPNAGLAEGREHFAIDFGHGEQRWISLRSAARKYVYWACEGFEEAYDLEADPEERRNLTAADDPPAWVERWRQQALAWERRHGLGQRSCNDDGFLRFAGDGYDPAIAEGFVTLNDGTWADHLPPNYDGHVETFAEAFNRAIAGQPTLSPHKLSVKKYRQQGGDLRGTAWEDAT
jgi:arylsulfatase A-like enzyme